MTGNENALAEEDEAGYPPGAMEENSRSTVELHMKHLKRHIGARLIVQNLTLPVLQSYIDTRSRENGQRGKLLSPTTIKKEITSFSGIWSIWSSKPTSHNWHSEIPR